MAVDPGTLNTYLAREYLLSELQLLPRFLRRPVRPLWRAAIPWLLLPAECAAENNLYAATAPAVEVSSAIRMPMNLYGDGMCLTLYRF